MNSVRKSFGYSFLSSNAVMVIQFLATIVISRLLSPAEVGIYSVAAVLVMIVQFLRDFGVSAYVIKAEELTQPLLRASLGLLMIMGFSIGILLFIFSGYIADFYNEPLLQSVLYILALNFFISPLGALTLTVARRNMRFSALAVVNIASALSSTVIAIGLAWAGFGPVSLAWGGLAAIVVTFLLSLRLRTAEMPWLPSLSGIRDIMTFGIAATSASILGHLNASISDLMLGRLLSMEAVGLFNRASSLNQFVNKGLLSAIGPVLFPWLSAIQRKGLDIGEAFQKATERTTVFTWPAFALVALLAEPAIAVLFGAQWTESARLVVYLSISAMIESAYTLSGVIYITIGRPSLSLFIEGLTLGARIVAIYLAAPYGLEAVAMTWPVISLLRAVVSQLVLYKVVNISFVQTIQCTWKSALITLSTLGIVYLGTVLLPSEHDWELLVKSLIFGALTWISTSFLLKHAIHEEIMIMAGSLRNWYSNR